MMLFEKVLKNIPTLAGKCTSLYMFLDEAKMKETPQQVKFFEKSFLWENLIRPHLYLNSIIIAV